MIGWFVPGLFYSVHLFADTFSYYCIIRIVYQVYTMHFGYFCGHLNESLIVFGEDR